LRYSQPYLHVLRFGPPRSRDGFGKLPSDIGAGAKSGEISRLSLGDWASDGAMALLLTLATVDLDGTAPVGRLDLTSS